jgi:hypothetical protein
VEIGITVSGTRLDDEVVASATREFLKDVRGDADPRARLVTGDATTGSKGGFMALGQLALDLVSGERVAKFIQAAFGFLGRHRKLAIEIQTAADRKLKLTWDYIDSHGEEKAMALVQSFLTKDT